MAKEFVARNGIIAKNDSVVSGSLDVTGALTACTLNLTDGSLSLDGDLTVGGTITAQEFKTELVSASILYQSGSTKFGDTSDDVHSFSGSLRVTGSGAHYFTDGNVGIGTSAPAYPLDVQGSSTTARFYSGAGTNTRVIVQADESESAFIEFYEGADRWATGPMIGNVAGLGGRYAVAARYNGSVHEAGIVMDSNLKIGIGTTAPGAKLDVRGSAVFNEDGGDNDFRVESNNNANMLFVDGGNDRVGIGTNAPTARLHVSASTGFSAKFERSIEDDGRSGFAHYYTPGNAHILGRPVMLESSFNFSPSSPDASSTLYRFQNTSNNLRVESVVAGAPVDNNILTISGSNIGLGTTAPGAKLDVRGSALFNEDGGDNDFRVESSGNANMLFVDGGNDRVGIGTNTPSSKLHVSGTGSGYGLRVNDNLYIGSGTVTAGRQDSNCPLTAQVDGNAFIRVASGNNGGNAGIQFHGAGDRGSIYGTIGYEIYVEPNAQYGQADFIINPKNGTTTNVGILTTTPQYRLDVSGSGNFTDGLTVTGSILHNGDLTVAGTLTAREFKTELVSASILYQSGSTKFGDTSDDVHSFSGSLRVTGSGDHYFTDGNVGIGTTSPSYKLDVSGSARIQGSSTITGNLNLSLGYFSTATYFIPGIDGGNSSITIKGQNYFHTVKYQTSWNNFVYSQLNSSYNTSDTYQDYFKSNNSGGVAGTTRISTGNSYFNGNVGIGTTSPGATLDVRGSAVFNEDSADVDFRVESNNNANMLFVDGGNDRVGIGTNSPSYPLDVTGIGRFTGAVYAVGADFGGTVSVTGADYFHVDNDPTLNATANDQVIAGIRVRHRGSDGGYTNVRRPLLLSENGGGGQHHVQLFETGLRIGPYSGGVSAVANPSAVLEARGTSGIIDLLDLKLYGGATALFVSSSGNVGIGTTSPSYTLHVSGSLGVSEGFDITGSMNIGGDLVVEGSITELSTERIKENILPLTETLDKVELIHGIKFNKIGSEQVELGFLAENIAEVYPEAVTFNEEGKPEGVHYSRLVPVLLQSVRELNQKVNEQNLFIEDLLERVEALEGK